MLSIELMSWTMRSDIHTLPSLENRKAWEYRFTHL
jgi:hypothetical protein